VGGLFILLIVAFYVQKLFNLMPSHLSIIALISPAIEVLSRKQLPMPVVQRLLPSIFKSQI
jgi:hypothetical protein